MAVDISELSAEATKKAAEAAAAEQAVEAALAAEDAAKDERERQWAEQYLASYNDAELIKADRDAWEEFRSAVTAGESGVGEFMAFRVTRNLRMARAQGITGLASQLGIPAPAVTPVTSGTERYIDALQQALDSAISNTVANELDRLDEERRLFVES